MCQLGLELKTSSWKLRLPESVLTLLLLLLFFTYGYFLTLRIFFFLRLLKKNGSKKLGIKYYYRKGLKRQLPISLIRPDFGIFISLYKLSAGLSRLHAFSHFIFALFYECTIKFYISILYSKKRRSSNKYPFSLLYR